ncbi:sugar ABC transporter ATP-binding protein [Curtobacterium sp. ISL-83]|uniref:sugar ABC transporter ATP-binding protein n=1 Tax=Curtobacterium sp. ISL-83 TaxID=2819145 RepID=UPI001BE9E938|nr:sugar ABC transporter ATP-binding protein [Curtobacterium sp. ISL-83]MBT2502267.1 sugar ABC transporter ATP-binding protein [Curtobacterium sp. ISL-83]
MTPAPSLQIRGLTKRFGPTTVLHDVSFTVEHGRILGLIGQNGAGKSTIVKTLAGLYPDHQGDVAVAGESVQLRSPKESRDEGIAVIYQEFSLVSEMTVAENLLLGREPGRFGYSRAGIRRRAEELVARIGIDLGAPVGTTVEGLSPAVHQRIEIVKALADDARVLVMDEPTARLSEAERVALFALMRRLAASGVGIVFISHYLDEVRDIADDITVLRNGAVVTTASSGDLPVNRMASLMLGDAFADDLHRERGESAAHDGNEVVLEARGLSDLDRLRDVDVLLRAGEILGLAGLVGSGRTRLARVLAGADLPSSGALVLRGEQVRFRGPRDAIRNGIVLIPEDRKHQALSMESPLTENLAIMAVQSRIGRAGFISRKAVRTLSDRLIHDLQVSPAAPDAIAATLSGGNQQKIVLGKALAAEPEVLIVDQPTAGVDIGTKAQIHDLLRARARAGAAVLVISDDLDELYALGDRFQALRSGRTVWTGTAAEITSEQLVELTATGTFTPAEVG